MASEKKIDENIEICLQIDNHYDKYFDLVYRYQMLRSRLNTSLKEGYLKITEARFARMCSHLPPESFSISNTSTDLYPSKFLKYNSKLSLVDAAVTSKYNDEKIFDSQFNEGLRLRTKPDKELQKASQIQNESIESDKISPLSIFGVLPPKQLRSAQEYFLNALKDSLEIISISKDIQYLEVSLNKLYDEK